MKIVFMGTPEFAVPSLNALLSSKKEITAVVTQPDKPSGRGKKLTPPPVKAAALNSGVAVLQPERIKDEEFVNTLREINPDVIVVAAYGKILPKDIIRLPRYGCINVHASFLPRYRGAAPINWAIINGEKETGITIMQMDEGLDTGSILLQKGIEITKEDTAGTLSNKLSKIGAELLIEGLNAIEKGEIKLIPQDNSKASYAPMLKKEDGQIDWTKGAEDIYNMVRGMDPWPGAFTYYKGELWKVWKVRHGDTGKGLAGEILAADKDRIDVASKDNVISIIEIQPANKKRMTVSVFLRGHKVEAGVILGK
ncbi:MAG: methionyl-tRNA formyltransferase [Nitrospirae bacterium RBG_19FT_COMBO_42_15]|nr:MAG: methionyl-tRNA formyltransferase [Nitrospirae bacterium RBG_19FT_COMBO_42_15]